jgi:ABC-2 type transport system ATP-binding protein
LRKGPFRVASSRLPQGILVFRPEERLVGLSPGPKMLIELDNVSKTYGKVPALAGLSVALPEGAIGLLGPNGAGKTTMIRTLLGLIAIDSGHGTVLGMDIRTQRLAIRQATGFVPEDECLFPGMNGVAAVAYAGELVGMGPKDALQRAHEVLDYVGLGEARYRRLESYSTGMKQRFKIAAAIVHDPRLLILDEPTNGMDPAGRDDVLELTTDLSRNKGMSLLFSSHLLPDVEAVCEYVMVLGGGRLLAQGRIADLKHAHNLEFELRVKGDPAEFSRRLSARGIPAEVIDEHLLVSLPLGTSAGTVWEIARDAGEQVRSLRPRRSTLEEVFLGALEGKH